MIRLGDDDAPLPFMSLILERAAAAPVAPTRPAPETFRRDRRLATLDLDGIDLVSLDVFDTLLFRTCHQPQALFPRLAAAARDAGLLADGIGVAGFVELRRLAERRARDRQGEVGLAEIYAELPAAIGPRDRLMALEIETEASVLVANPAMVDLLLWLQARAVPVWLVSDMYLGEHHLARLLDRAGVERALYRRLLVSCDERLTKAEGGLFDRLVALSGIPARRILHIGDNPASDGAVPAARGLRTLPYAPPPAAREALRRERLLGAEQSSLRSVARELAASRRPADEPLAFWVDYGATVVGPLVEAYGAWIAGQAAARGIDLVLPFMREGKLIGRAIAAADPALAVRPLSVSRAALRLAAIGRLDEAALDTLATTSLVRTLADLAGLLGLQREPEDWAPWRDRRLIDLVAVRDETGDLVWPRLRAGLLTDPARREIEARAAEARARAARYLDGAIGTARRVATVDLGARGSTQAMVEDVCRPGQDAEFDHFLFYGVRAIAGHRLEAKRFHLFMPETERHYELAELIHRASHFLELLICGNERTTLSYRDGRDGAVEPVLGPVVAPAWQQAAIAACWRGIESYQAVIAEFPKIARPVDPAEIMAIAERAIHLPTVDEAAALGALVYDFNDGSAAERQICDADALAAMDRLGGLAAGTRLKLAQQLRQSAVPWPQGAITLREGDAIERAIEAARAGTGITEICRHLIDRVQAGGARQVLLYAAGGAGGMGPAFLAVARERGLEVAGYLDHLPGRVGERFEGVPVLAPDDLADHPVRTIAVCSTGYAAAILDTIERACAGCARPPTAITTGLPD